MALITAIRNEGRKRDMIAPVLSSADLDQLVRLRLAVARFGEMDGARWWNTRGMLGRLGSLALKRGFPRSHVFAQARAAFAVASDRCREVYDPPSGFTLWKLPSSLEDQFESHWHTCIAEADRWRSFVDELQDVACDLLDLLRKLNLLSDAEAHAAMKFRRSVDRRAVPVPGNLAAPASTCRMLAAGFFRGEPGEPAIPYVGAANV